MRGILDTAKTGERVAVPRAMLDESARASDHYILRVVGDSMIDEGICDGDFIVCLRRDFSEPGKMVVALVGNTATLNASTPRRTASPGWSPTSAGSPSKICASRLSSSA